MKERELLELAAKASKLSVSQTVPFYDDSNGLCLANNCWWNPLTDDGDAFRLAVKLKMLLNCLTFCAMDSNNSGVEPNHNWHCADNISDPSAAIRLVIVRAAAEIGKSMQ